MCKRPSDAAVISGGLPTERRTNMTEILQQPEFTAPWDERHLLGLEHMFAHLDL